MPYNNNAPPVVEEIPRERTDAHIGPTLHGGTQLTASTSVRDPFSTPPSSRPSSRHHQFLSQKVSFSDTSSGVLSVPRTPTDGIFPSATSNHIPIPRSILNNPSRLSMLPSARSSAVPLPSGTTIPRKLPRMKSYMVTDRSDLSKPWTEKPSPRVRIAYLLTYAVILIGFAGGIIQCYFSYVNAQLDRKPLCLVMEENFDSEDSVFGENGSFNREVNMDGFGTGEFEMTTASQNNSFVKDGFLYIVPTLTSDSIGNNALFDGTVYNITGCTFNQTRPNNGFITENGATFFDEAGYLQACSAVSNRTAGTVINPVQSARINTKGKASIRYGRVEIKAKMPNGDWLWPALWMLPVNEVYGSWPLSGEIDIVESRGNGLQYTARGSNYVQGSLNWGPTTFLNGVSNSYSWWTERRRSFGSSFRTYALEWTDKWLRIYVDNRLHTLLDIKFNEPFFERGQFPEVIFDGSNPVALQNPWINGTNATPFDQDFYLIMNVAVGGTNGWFPEAQGNKPWLNGSPNAMRDFALAEANWYSTWPNNVEDRAMIVDYVKMWKHCDGS